MKRYHAYAIATASKYLGEIEAENEEAAKEAAYEHDQCEMSLCHHCSKIDLGDIYEIQVEEIEEA
jgi:hypothetical protein